jgi:hypothetical protein
VFSFLKKFESLPSPKKTHEERSIIIGFVGKTIHGDIE